MEVRRLEQMLALLGGSFLTRMHSDIADELRGLEDFVNDQQKGGTVELTLKVKFNLDRDRLLRMSGEYKLASPKQPVAQGIAWLDDGALTPQNPMQRHFDFPDNARAVPAPRAEGRNDVIDIPSDRRVAD